MICEFWGEHGVVIEEQGVGQGTGLPQGLSQWGHQCLEAQDWPKASQNASTWARRSQ